MLVGLPEHACNRIVVDNSHMKSTIGMPQLGWEATLGKDFAKQDQRDLVEAFVDVRPAASKSSVEEFGQLYLQGGFIPCIISS